MKNGIKKDETPGSLIPGVSLLNQSNHLEKMDTNAKVIEILESFGLKDKKAAE